MQQGKTAFKLGASIAAPALAGAGVAAGAATGVTAVVAVAALAADVTVVILTLKEHRCLLPCSAYSARLSCPLH